MVYVHVYMHFIWDYKYSQLLQINVRENSQSRMDNTETLATLGTQDENGQYIDTGNNGYTGQEWTIQTLATLGTQDKNGQYRDTGNIGYTR